MGTTTIVAPAAPPQPAGAAVAQPAGAAVAQPVQAATPVTTEADRLSAVARSVFGEDFAGVTFTSRNPIVFTRDARGRKDIVGVPVKEVQHSLDELEAARDSLSSYSDEATAQGVTLHSFGVDIETNSLEITLVDPDGSTSSPTFRKSKRIIERHLGGVPITWNTARKLASLNRG